MCRISHYSCHVYHSSHQTYSSFCLECPRVPPHTLILGLKNSFYKTQMSHSSVKIFLIPQLQWASPFVYVMRYKYNFCSFNLPPTTVSNRYYYRFHFLDKKTKADKVFLISKSIACLLVHLMHTFMSSILY